MRALVIAAICFDGVGLCALACLGAGHYGGAVLCFLGVSLLGAAFAFSLKRGAK